MKRITVLGCGMVGSAIAADLADNYKVTICDINKESLKELSAKVPVNTLQTDISDKKSLIKSIKGSDLVVDAVPGFMGYSTLKTVIEAGINVVAISFFNEDPFELDNLARLNNVTAIVDCGIGKRSPS